MISADHRPSAPCAVPTEKRLEHIEQYLASVAADKPKDQVQRWMPTIIALVGILSTLLYQAREFGRLEERLEYVRQTTRESVSRVEYQAHRDAAAQQYRDLREGIAEINRKLDRLPSK
jgi:hypothetical protein